MVKNTKKAKKRSTECVS